MRHRKKGKLFGRVRKQRAALLKQLSSSLVLRERMVTTEAKAKAVRPYIERIIAHARKGEGRALAGKRYAYRFLSHEAAKILLRDRMARFANRASGWTRITKLSGWRKDGARRAMIEFVDKRV